VRGLPAWALKAGAVGLTLLATYGSASYVGGHVKSPAAPLRPAVHPAVGQVTLLPGVTLSGREPVTETHVS
jgi:hypothetical protein